MRGKIQSFQDKFICFLHITMYNKNKEVVILKLIALDMDGTLLSSSLEISKENLQAIQTAKRGWSYSHDLFWSCKRRCFKIIGRI